MWLYVLVYNIVYIWYLTKSWYKTKLIPVIIIQAVADTHSITLIQYSGSYLCGDADSNKN